MLLFVVPIGVATVVDGIGSWCYLTKGSACPLDYFVPLIFITSTLGGLDICIAGADRQTDRQTDQGFCVCVL